VWTFSCLRFKTILDSLRFDSVGCITDDFPPLWMVLHYPHCLHQLYTVSQQMCHPILTINSSNLNRFAKFFHLGKYVKFPTTRYITLPTTPEISFALPQNRRGGEEKGWNPVCVLKFSLGAGYDRRIWKYGRISAGAGPDMISGATLIATNKESYMSFRLVPRVTTTYREWLIAIIFRQTKKIYQLRMVPDILPKFG